MHNGNTKIYKYDYAKYAHTDFKIKLYNLVLKTMYVNCNINLLTKVVHH